MVGIVGWVGAGGQRATVNAAPAVGYVSLDAPARILDTRPGSVTADAQFAGGGIREFGSTLQLVVAGRVGVPADAAAVVLNVTVTETTGAGFITVFPCGGGRPTASNLNYVAGQNTPNLVITKIGTGGMVCLFNGAATHLIVDVAGYFPGVDAFIPLATPARLLDTRPGGTTIDGVSAGAGIRPNGSVQVLQVTDRAGIPTGAASVILNVTVDQSQLAGFITVYPCGGSIPTASNVNYIAGQTVANAVVSKLAADGTTCLYDSAATHLIVDVAGYFADAAVLIPLAAPARLLDTRAGGATVDGSFSGSGLRPSQGTIQLSVGGRAGVPATASAVVLNVTVDQAQANGFITVYPTGVDRPNASNLNYVVGQTVPNAVIARLGTGGQLCLFSLGATHLIVDVAAYITGPAPVASSTGCPTDPAPPPVPPVPPPPPPPGLTFVPGTYQVNVSIPPGRYVAEGAHNGCYWERLNGFGGSLAEINANDFQNFTGRVIVDILPTDVGFHFTAGCGTFKTYVPSGALASTIVPGNHVVGQHIVAGTYTTNAAAGCYWQRSRSFDGTSSAIIANDFVSPGAQIIVTIDPSDAGFYTDGDCGVWTRL